MTMTPGLRKFALSVHVTATVGWLGAVVVFLALAVVGLTSPDAATVRGAYLVMEPAAWFVLVPLALASLLTGLVVSLGTAWGLFRHYWVLAKLVITIFATIVLLIYMKTFRFMAAVAADPGADLGAVRNASPQPPRRPRPAAVAGGHGARDIQTAWHDPLRAAYAARSAYGLAGDPASPDDSAQPSRHAHG